MHPYRPVTAWTILPPSAQKYVSDTIHANPQTYQTRNKIRKWSLIAAILVAVSLLISKNAQSHSSILLLVLLVLVEVAVVMMVLNEYIHRRLLLVIGSPADVARIVAEQCYIKPENPSPELLDICDRGLEELGTNYKRKGDFAWSDEMLCRILIGRRQTLMTTYEKLSRLGLTTRVSAAEYIPIP